MGTDWEQIFSKWIGRASDAEQERYEWTLREVRQALGDHQPLSAYAYESYPKGSYPNFTNVVRDSDVDVAVEMRTSFNYVFRGQAEGMTREEAGISLYTGNLTLASFKDEVSTALTRRFGANNVRRGSKAIHLRESARGLAADVVPCQTHRLYRRRSPGGYEEGILLLDDDHPLRELVNFPRQHLQQGQVKNNETSRRYKRVVRILKRLENLMVEEKIIAPVPSFLIESAIWNVPNRLLSSPPTWTQRVRGALLHVYQGCNEEEAESSSEWLEANGIKYLFHPTQGWSRGDITNYVDKAWDHLGF